MGAMTKHYHTLDALRGVAALCVVVYHMAVIPHLRAPSGYLAVDFFFALSGFVIAHAYGASLRGDRSVSAFMRARLIRLYPILFLGFVAAVVRGAAMLALQPDKAPSHTELFYGATVNLLILPAPLLTTYMFLNWPAWSLMFELLVNWLYAGIVRRLTRPLLWAIVTASGLWLAYLVLFRNGAGGGATLPTFHVGLARVLFSFFLGVIIYENRDLPAFAALRGAINPFVIAVLLGVALLSPIRHPLYDLAFVFLISPALLVAGSRLDPFPGANYLGQMSYAVYAIHFSLLSVGSFIATKLRLEPWIGMVATVAAFCAAVPLIISLYERPMRRWLAGFGAGRAASAT